MGELTFERDRGKRGGLLLFVLLCGLAVGRIGAQDSSPPAPEPALVYPCDDYTKGARGGNFGVHVTKKDSPFRDTWHLAEDIWLPGGTEVRSIADGVVRYSAFSPTWTDDNGHVHWNLGNVIVIEHGLGEGEKLEAICSVYVHLAADRRVAVGERVLRGQVIGRIGKSRSEENGRYPAHLHFGLHRGPYVQISPSLVRSLHEASRSEAGLRFGDAILRGDLEVKLSGKTSVLITEIEGGESALLSLLVGSTAPKDPPPDIMGWCNGYGDEKTLEEWIEPSTFLRARTSK